MSTSIDEGINGATRLAKALERVKVAYPDAYQRNGRWYADVHPKEINALHYEDGNLYPVVDFDTLYVFPRSPLAFMSVIELLQKLEESQPDVFGELLAVVTRRTR